MAFTVKNLSPYPLYVLGTTMDSYSSFDLTAIATNAQIVSSLMNGELYNQLQGKLIAVLGMGCFQQIGATQAQIDFWAKCGFLQGRQGDIDLRYPFTFTPDGYLEVAASITANIGTVTVDTTNALDVYNLAPGSFVGNYSTLRGDATATWASTTTLTFTGPTIVSSQLRRVYAFFDQYTKPYIWEQGINAVLTISSTTITVYCTDGYTVPLPASTNTVAVDWVAQDKAYDPSTQSMRVALVYSDASRSILQDCSNATAVAGGVTTSYYLDMFGYHGFSLQLYSTAGTNAKTIKILASNQDDGTAPASCNYNDMTLDWCGTSGVSIAAGTVTAAYFINKPVNVFVKYVQIQVITAAAGATDNTWVMYARKVY